MPPQKAGRIASGRVLAGSARTGNATFAEVPTHLTQQKRGEMMRVRNIKETVDGARYYRLVRTLPNGKRHQMQISFSAGEMRFRSFVAQRLWLLRAEMRASTRAAATPAPRSNMPQLVF
ncbi:hypothetical protein [Pandoraea pnomenusa]|uniref:hypothetical protein n=1 Tax=Pandoraea pnomenusa TaxID=93220 RepID=UPI0012DA505C|nr:hypothetical protein [Pandoraea pnomenusa]